VGKGQGLKSKYTIRLVGVILILKFQRMKVGLLFTFMLVENISLTYVYNTRGLDDDHETV